MNALVKGVVYKVFVHNNHRILKIPYKIDFKNIPSNRSGASLCFKLFTFFRPQISFTQIELLWSALLLNRHHIIKHNKALPKMVP